MDDSTLRIIFTGGGSGGHVYPLVAVSGELKRLAWDNKINSEFFYMGPYDEYAGILSAAGFKVNHIPAGKLRRYFSIDNIIDVPKFFIGFLAALFKMFFLMPDAIFSKGGTGALAVVLAGWLYGIPVMIHESDATPGLTNLLSAPFAARVAVSFEGAMNYFNRRKVAWTGAPVRTELLGERENPEAAKKELGFDPKASLTVVLGGSLGSKRINEFVVTNLSGLLAETQVLHQTGQSNYEEVEGLARAELGNNQSNTLKTKGRYKALPYLDLTNFKAALTACDLVITRAGSGTIFEIATFGKPSILIPLKEAANDHQRANAYEFAKTGAAAVIEEQNLLPNIFLTQARTILKNPETIAKMSAASEKFFKPGAAEMIAKEILRISR